MKIAIVAPSPVPFTIGGAENLHWGLLHHINQHTPHQAELIKLPSPELNLPELVKSYRKFSRLDLSHFDLLISTKYPAWMATHANHVCYMLHRLRGLYDTYHLCDQPEAYDGQDPEILRFQDFMHQNRSRRSALNEFFDRWDELFRSKGSASEPNAFRFPGPLAREIIHFLDGIGLSTEAIKEYAAISANVAGRRDYFPEPDRVQVIHPPSNLTGFRRGAGKFLFTVSRLDGPKRIALLVEAMGHVASDIPLKIAGSGPDEAKLRQMACGDSRIEFLGFVNDTQVMDYYSNALAVLFVPRDEDYGLVTVEAMMCGKPVITVTDAGGPNEFVENGRTGFSTPPEPVAIAEKIDYLCRHPGEAAEMGLRGRQRVKHITWAHTVAALLQAKPAAKAKSKIKPRTGEAESARICVAVPFGVFPPRGGGQQRVFHLYRHLATALGCRIDLVTLEHSGQKPMQEEIAPGLREIRIPKSIEHERAEQRLSDEAGSIPVTDVALPELFGLTPAFGAALEKYSREAAVVIASHPYCMPVIQTACPGKEIIYEAHNVEADLKEKILTTTKTGQRLLKQTIAVENECCRAGCFIQVCSTQDAERLQDRYVVSPEKIWIVPNGVDLESIPFCDFEERLRIKKRIGATHAFISLFTGSWHGPNVAALETILDLAVQVSDMFFLVMGSVGLAVQDQKIPPNVGLLGVIDNQTREVVLHSVDVALNPMVYGSGTNLKMLEYAAAGVPILSTPHGARGLALADEQYIEITELDGFSAALHTMRDHRARLKSRILRARNCVVTHYDWVNISNRLARLFRRHTDWFPVPKTDETPL